jgi:hypothetical protein
VLALAIGAALRLEVALTAPPFLVANDSADYFSAGFNLLTTGELQLSVKRTPLYSLFLAGVMAVVGPSLEHALAAQHALGLLTVVLTFVLGRMAFGPTAAGVAALGVAINGSLLAMEHLIISEALCTPLMLAGLVVALAAHRRRQTALWLPAGLLLGLGALCRPLGIAVPGVVLISLIMARRPHGRLVGGAGLLLLGTALCVGPWVARQTVVHEQAVVNGGLGDALFSRVRRYDPTFTLRDDGWAGTESERAIRARIVELASHYEYPREVRAVLRVEFGIDDVEADRRLREVALSTIAYDPGRYLLGTLAMAGRLARGSEPGLPDLWLSVRRDRVLQGWPLGLRWALATDRLTDDAAPFDRVRFLLALFRDDLPSGLAPLALAPLGAAWAVLAHRRAGTGVIPLVVITQIVLYVALDGPLFRYRFPLQPLITLLGAAGLALMLQHLRAAWHEILRMPTSELTTPPSTSAEVGISGRSSPG